VAIHIHKKEHKERASNAGVNDSGNGRPPTFTATTLIEYAISSVYTAAALER